MKLSDLVAELRERMHLIAVYEDLVDHLETLLQESEAVPIEGSDESVDPDYVKMVVDKLRADQQVHKTAMAELENYDVVAPAKAGEPSGADKRKRPRRT